MNNNSISLIVDFSDIIPENKNTYNFNPSIAHWKEDLYLCSYRSFIRYKDFPFLPKYADEHLTDPNHPWLGGPGSKTWWSNIDGKDNTSFFIMKIKNNRVFNVKSLNDGKSVYLKNNKTKTFKFLTGVDTRLLHLKDNYFIVSYNILIQNKNLKIKNNQNCERGCFVIATQLLYLNPETLSLEILGTENIMCPQISNRIEKNWSFWFYSDQLFFTYGLAPKQIIYNVKIDYDNGKMYCTQPLDISKGYFGYFEEIYNISKNKDFFISVTTPAIRRIDKPNTYIAVGHVKYKNNQEKIKLLSNSPLASFFVKTNNFKRHPVYDYLMFIYEFDPNNGQLIAISDMFIPEGSDYILSFPSGIAYSGPTLIISYGDHDARSKLLAIRPGILNKILKPIIYTDKGIISPHPNEIGFFIFPQKCIKKDGICKLITL